MTFYRNWPKTNLHTRAHQKGPYFSETIFCRVFWDMSLILPKDPRKKFILLSKFDKKKIKKLSLKVRFFGLKLYNFNFIASQLFRNIQMPNPSQLIAKLKIIKGVLPTSVQFSHEFNFFFQ